jgi:hypothetical protein
MPTGILVAHLLTPSLSFAPSAHPIQFYLFPFYPYSRIAGVGMCIDTPPVCCPRAKTTKATIITKAN